MSSQGSAEEYKKKGNTAYSSKDYKTAVQCYSEAIAVDTSSRANSVYLSNRAAAYMAIGDYKNGLADCLKADSLDVNNEKILSRLAKCQTLTGHPEDGLRTLERITHLDVYNQSAFQQQYRQSTELNNVIGTAKTMIDNRNGGLAIHSLNQASTLLKNQGQLQEPDNWRRLRAEAYLINAISNEYAKTENELGEAAKITTDLLRQNNQDVEALNLRGRILYYSGDAAKAINHFQQALRCDPDNSVARNMLKLTRRLEAKRVEGNEAFKTSRWQDAVDLYSEGLDIDKDNKSVASKLYHNRALAFSRLGKYKESIDDCNAALKLDSDFTKVRRTRARAYMKIEEYTEAVNDFKQALEEDNDQALRNELRQAELELKKSQRKDYYKILQVAKDATDHEIKKAYRKRALDNHPDKNPDDPKAEARFKDISEAYECLSDPQKRQRYDSGVDLDTDGGMGGGMHVDPSDLFNMFNQMNGGGGGGGFSFGGGGDGHFHSFGGGGRQQGFHNHNGFSF